MRPLGLVAALALVAVGCGVDREQVRACQRLIPAFERRPETVDVLRAEPHTSSDNAITLRYRAADAAGQPVDRWIACWFAGSAFDAGRLTLVSVATDRHGALSAIQLRMLGVWLRLPHSEEERAADDPKTAVGPPVSRGLRLLQQTINAIPRACVYGLVAIGFSLVYGVVGRINLAFGEFSTIGAHVALIGVALLAAIGWNAPILGVSAVLLVALGVGAGFGAATERLVFRPLRGAGTQAPLIAMVGLAMFLRELIRLAQGSRDRWLPPIPSEPHALVGDGGDRVPITSAQLSILALTLVLCTSLALVMRRSRFGREYRACRDDGTMATLVGVNVDRISAFAFGLGGALAGAAGAIVAFRYGAVGAYMGVLIGFKALVAAIVGDLGSIEGAILGGILLDLLETLWSAYLTADHRDIAVFALLAAILVFRPEGLLGHGPTRAFYTKSR